MERCRIVFAFPTIFPSFPDPDLRYSRIAWDLNKRIGSNISSAVRGNISNQMTSKDNDIIIENRIEREQECIQVGCEPSAGMAVSGAGCPSRGVSAWGFNPPNPEADPTSSEADPDGARGRHPSPPDTAGRKPTCEQIHRQM